MTQLDLVEKNRIRKAVIEAAIEVHRELGGPGLLERVFKNALMFELKERRLGFQNQLTVPLVYKSQQFSNFLCVDLLIVGES
jgi:GxxExxY protein